jgi:DNA/RNA-binding domain of Phe-tRNA-synthetase-like protein
MQFRQTDATIDLGLKTVTWIEHGLDNRGDTDQLTALRGEFYEQARSDNASIEETIDGYCRLRERIGRSIRRFPPSPIALHGQFTRRRELGSISMAVDLYNLVSLATGLSIGAHDLSTVIGDIRLDLTQGNEPFHPLGSDEIRQVPAGEYAYLDQENRVLCRMEYRQSAMTALSEDSRDCLFIVQGHQDSNHDQLIEAAEQVSDLLGTWCGSRRGSVWQTP